MAGGSSQTQTQAELPQELKDLNAETANRLRNAQARGNIQPFFGSRPQQTAGLGGAERGLLGYITNQAAQQGPTSLERQGVGASTQALNAAYRPVQLTNVADQQGLSTLNQLGRLGNTQLQAPSSDRQIHNNLGRATNLSFQQLPGTTEQEQQALGSLDTFGQLAGTNLDTLSGQEGQALGQLGQLGDLNQQQLPTLSGLENQAVGQLGQLGELNQQQLQTFYAPEQQAYGALQPFLQGELGSSPATQAAMAAFYDQALPELQSQLALRGLSRSGAAAESIGRAQQQAYIPLVQQELEQRFQAVPLLQQLGAVQGDRERQDITRQLQVGSQLAGQTADIGAAEQARSREDITRQLQAGLQIAGQTSDIGAAEQAREREDLNRQLSSYSQLADQYSGIGNTLAQREISNQAQQFGQASQLGQQYQGLSEMLAGRQREDLNRQLQTQFGIAEQQFGLGQTIGDRQAGNRQAIIDTSLQNANFLGQLGNQVATRDFDEQLRGLEAAALPRDIENQRASNVYQDYLRRQALTEQTLLAPLSSGVVTSGIGQAVSGSQSGLIPGVTK